MIKIFLLSLYLDTAPVQNNIQSCMVLKQNPISTEYT